MPSTTTETTFRNAAAAHRVLVSIMAHADEVNGCPHNGTADDYSPASNLAERFANNLSESVLYPLAHEIAGTALVCETGTDRCGCPPCTTERIMDDAAAVWERVPVSAI